MKIIEALKSRRVLGAIFGSVAFILTMFGYSTGLDVNGLTEAVLSLLEACASIAAIALPVWSYFKPKA